MYIKKESFIIINKWQLFSHLSFEGARKSIFTLIIINVYNHKDNICCFENRFLSLFKRIPVEPSQDHCL